MRRWTFAQCVGVAAGVAGVAWVLGDAVMKVGRRRHEELRARTEELVAVLGAVERTVTGIVAPEPQSPTARVHEGERMVTGTTAGQTSSVSPYARPEWPDPVQLGEDTWTGLEDPTDLSSPLDYIPESLMAAATLAGAVGPFDAPASGVSEPVPEIERLSGPGRAATFSPGENPLEDIGEVPVWVHDYDGGYSSNGQHADKREEG